MDPSSLDAACRSGRRVGQRKPRHTVLRAEPTKRRPAGGSTGCVNLALDEALVAVYGDVTAATARCSGWRSLGATALELAMVASGTLDGYVVAQRRALPAWDYLAGLLLMAEAGGCVSDAGGGDAWVVHADARRAPAAAGTRLLSATPKRLAWAGPPSATTSAPADTTPPPRG